MSQDIAERFAAIRAFYRRHARAIEADGNEWFGDPYAWDCEAGIKLTPIEWALWQDIRAEDAVLYPQFPVGRFFVDFGNPVARVAIECDGARWHQGKERDAARQAEIESLGWAVYRITGRDCLTDTEEAEDENGRPLVRAGAASVFIRNVCDRHPLRRCDR